MGNCCAKEEPRILMLGVGAAGKTTILYRLKNNEIVHTFVSASFTMETVHFGDLEFCVWDLGGQDKMRPLWRHYFADTKGIIFVVDSSDSTQYQTAKTELHQIAQAPQLKGCPILIFANKQDVEGAVDVDKLSAILELNALESTKYHMEACCALTGVGLVQGMDWLSQAVVSNK